MEIDFYDKSGVPIAYTEDEVHVYLFSGKSAAYIDEGSIYSYSGKHLGWFEDGCVYDYNGNCVFFTSESIGEPILPVKGVKPIKGVKQLNPVKGIKQIKPVKPIRQFRWSDISAELFFN